MSFTKLPYDSCAYTKDLQESEDVGKYMLNTPKNDCGENCFHPSPHVRLDKKNIGMCKNKLIVDVHSELLGLNMKLSECPSKRTIDPLYCENAFLKDCENTFLAAEETKISNPPGTLRGTGWNRWEWLCTNPQDNAIVPFETNIQNKTIVKDNHRPCLPTLKNSDPVLPNDDNVCITDKGQAFDKMYDNEEQVPFIHWRPCCEINKL